MGKVIIEDECYGGAFLIKPLNEIIVVTSKNVSKFISGKKGKIVFSGKNGKLTIGKYLKSCKRFFLNFSNFFMYSL